MMTKDEAQKQVGMMRIEARFEGVSLSGPAQCDHVAGAGGKTKLRARFGYGIKAVLDFDHYGTHWDAEVIPEEKGVE
ncbi:MAG: hypothetical protein IJ048_03730 [Clostridia bacterium]|nr:hypothetical protein [Clostridia bacterium]